MNQCGKNIAELDFLGLYNSADGIKNEVTYSDYASTKILKCNPNTTYCVQLSGGISQLFAYYWDENSTYISGGTSITQNYFTVPNNAYYFAVTVRRNGGKTSSLANFIDFQLELGNTPTDYIPYSQTTHTATFPDTVYGGKFDFVSGKLTITHEYKNMGDWNWNYNGTYLVFWINKGDAKLSNNIICDSFTPTASTINISGWENKPNNTIGMVSGTTSYRLCVKDSRYTDTSLFKTAMNGVYVCYELATPQEITFTAETIELLKGNNVLFTDGDSVKLVYSADIKSYIAEQLSSLS